MCGGHLGRVAQIESREQDHKGHKDRHFKQKEAKVAKLGARQMQEANRHRVPPGRGELCCAFSAGPYLTSKPRPRRLSLGYNISALRASESNWAKAL